MTRRPRPSSQRGAMALEFALVLPMLLLLVFGVAEFGRAYYQTITLTHAAREGVRVWALGGTTAEAISVTQAAAHPLAGVAVTTTACTPSNPTRVTASKEFTWIFLSSNSRFADFTMTGTAVMRCGG